MIEITGRVDELGLWFVITSRADNTFFRVACQPTDS